jgi:hypothetical protein
MMKEGGGAAAADEAAYRKADRNQDNREIPYAAIGILGGECADGRHHRPDPVAIRRYAWNQVIGSSAVESCAADSGMPEFIALPYIDTWFDENPRIGMSLLTFARLANTFPFRKLMRRIARADK